MRLADDLEAQLAALAERFSWSEQEIEAVRAWVLSLAGPPTRLDGADLFSTSLAGGSVLGPLTASGWRPVATGAEPPEPAPAAPSGRYQMLARLGGGGMGEVWRVRDRDLNRTLAMKLLRPEISGALARFVEEAQITAQLQHPAIVPVHEIGRLADGRCYFTMKEIRGQTLGAAIAAAHRASGPDGWGAAGGWDLRRLVEALRRAAEAVAFAHDRGVVHRDIKPSNVMVDRFGAVQVVDWGVARILGRAPRGVEAPDEPVVTDRSRSDGLTTRPGVVLGTPAYMPPEQAYGWIARIDARSDVYALGATLYHALAGRPPYADRPDATALEQVLAGPPPPIAAAGGPPAPPALVAACERAMARELSRRYASALAFVDALSGWLSGG